MSGILKDSITQTVADFVTLDGWSAAVEALILDVTLKFIDNEWNMKFISLMGLNIVDTFKT